MRAVSLDFESYSEADLKRTGTFRYAEDPTTEVLCLAFSFDEEEDVQLWHPAHPELGLPEEGRDQLERLAEAAEEGALFWAWNAMFERCLWEMVLRRQAPWLPSVPRGSWRCSAALAATYALPRKLEDCARGLGLRALKDKPGAAAMRRLMRPAKPTKTKAGGRHKTAEDLALLYPYCRQDVRLEKGVKSQLRPFTPSELACWQLDQDVNLRGLYVDSEMAAAALRHAAAIRAKADDRVRRLTRGTVPGTTKRADLLTWLEHDRGVRLPNLRKATLDAVLDADLDLSREEDFSADERDEPEAEQVIAALPPDVREVLQLWRSVNRTSSKKYRAMLEGLCLDGRMRDLFRYHAASTGRWGGQRVQPHNFPRGSVKVSPDAVARDIVEGDPDYLDLLYGDAMAALSSALRCAIRAAPGQELVCADFAAIESRLTFWFGGDLEALEVIAKSDRKEGPDIYRVQAGEVYNLRPETIGKDSPERQMGKQAVLGLGFQMGAPKFRTTCAGYGIEIDLPFSKRVVQVYRESHPGVVDFWYELERNAIEAVKRGDGASVVWDRRRRVGFAVRGRFLHCRLPSGRLLSYMDPSVVQEPFVIKDPETGEKRDLGLRDKLKFWGVDTYTHQWARQSTYGGKLTENVVQATARDLMALALPRVEEEGYPVVLHCHDEILSEVPTGYGSVREFEALMSVLPEWAEGLPLAAEGWRGVRYRK